MGYEGVEHPFGTCLDPRQRGPYGVGARVVHLVKDSFISPGVDADEQASCRLAAPQGRFVCGARGDVTETACAERRR